MVTAVKRWGVHMGTYGLLGGGDWEFYHFGGVEEIPGLSAKACHGLLALH